MNKRGKATKGTPSTGSAWVFKARLNCIGASILMFSPHQKHLTKCTGAVPEKAREQAVADTNDGLKARRKRAAGRALSSFGGDLSVISDMSVAERPDSRETLLSPQGEQSPDGGILFSNVQPVPPRGSFVVPSPLKFQSSHNANPADPATVGRAPCMEDIVTAILLYVISIKVRHPPSGFAGKLGS